MLTLLQEVAEEVINPRFRSLDDDQITEKNPGDLVTVADREAEVLITAALQAAYPDALILGEEATHADKTLVERYYGAEHAFTVDPVDGTKNFVKGSKDHAVMASEVRGGAVVRAWIWQPQHATAYVAERGAGAYRDGERLVRPPVGEALRGVTSRRRWIGRALGVLTALDLTWVCCGSTTRSWSRARRTTRSTARASRGTTLPASCCSREAGGYVGTFDGQPYDPQRGIPSGLVAAADRPTYDLVQGLIDDLPGL